MAAWLGFVHQEEGEAGLRELLDHFANPTPDFIRDLANEVNTTTAHDLVRIEHSLLPDIVRDFPAIARELQAMGLFDAASVIVRALGI